MQWGGLTIGSVYFNSIDIIVFSLAIIGGIADTSVGLLMRSAIAVAIS